MAIRLLRGEGLRWQCFRSGAEQLEKGFGRAVGTMPIRHPDVKSVGSSEHGKWNALTRSPLRTVYWFTRSHSIAISHMVFLHNHQNYPRDHDKA
jgi:hypothetical protein